MNEFIEETAALLDVAVLGKQVDDFLRSDVGDYLMQCIDKEAAEGAEALLHVNPSDPGAVLAAQYRVKSAQMMKKWLQGAVAAGLKATEILESREDGDDL